MKTLKEYAAMTEDRLQTILPEPETLHNVEGEMPELLAKSMRYSLLAGGKHLRASMFMAVVELLGGQAEDVLDFACAIEMIHTYSLIHDDLPGMDNDSLRRGKLTNHVVFGEGQAILAGDGLLNNAFETMLRHALKTPKMALPYLRAINEVACGSGVTGMIAGQVIDLQCEKDAAAGEKELSYVQRNKTACMFIYPMRAAARIMEAGEEKICALTEYADAFGRLFQATDDLLDVVGDSAMVGKTLGKDAEEGKLTCISIYGIDGTRAFVQKLHDKAIEAVSVFGDDALFFTTLVDAMVMRTY